MPPFKSALVHTREESSMENYTIFSKCDRTVITILLGSAMLMSPLAATIYLPLLPLLSTHFHTSIQAINLTITVYIICQAISPLLLASISDSFGRRPVYLFASALYTVASLGLALNKSSYAALLVLRALQSLGASCVLSVCYGTMSDICVPAQRGKMLGPMMVAGNVGTCIGPVVGGGIALASGSYQWVFWALCLFGAAMLSILAILLPETARNVVGNGSIEDAQWNQPLWILLRRCWKRFQGNPTRSTEEKGAAAKKEDRTGHLKTQAEWNVHSPPRPTRSFQIKSPLAVVKVLFYRDTSLIIWLSSSYYALWYCVQATIPTTYKSSPYRFTDLQVGLAYLPGAAGVIISVYLSSKFLDWNYKATARKAGFTVDKVKGDDLANFPIEEARSRWSDVLILVEMCATVGYGWSIKSGVHASVPLILQFLMGLFGTWMVQVYAALLVDTFPEMPSTAATCGNVSRSVLSAVAVAALQPLINCMGKGWVFTLFGLLSGIGGIAAHAAVRRWGRAWRSSRRG
ncbi:MFS general substrate transporter [Stipitochalara longipes BDJ]|nr:MFS general substrate transporter [Stipitochalara longipes BDJ]